MSVDDAYERRREIGRQVARWRARRGLTRRQFADLCSRSLSWVDKVESGERGLLRLPMLERVTEVLHVSVETLTDTDEARQARHCLDLFEISAIRAALQSYQAISRVFVPTAVEMAEPPDLDRLTQQVTYAWMAFQNAHWPLLGQALPPLLTTAQTAVAAYPGTDDQARRVRTLLSQAYQVTASTLWKLKEADLAWLAAERGLVLAEETGDSLLISDAARRVAQGLMVMSYHDQALELVRADIDRLEPGRGTGSSTYLSLYGMLFLMGAVVAARANNHAAARALLDEGHGRPPARLRRQRALHRLRTDQRSPAPGRRAARPRRRCWCRRGRPSRDDRGSRAAAQGAARQLLPRRCARSQPQRSSRWGSKHAARGRPFVPG